MSISLDVPEEDFLKALSIRFCRHYPAMEVARMFAGRPSAIWKILEKYTPHELLQEVNENSIDISNLETSMAKCKCCHSLVIDSPLYQKIQSTISESA